MSPPRPTESLAVARDAVPPPTRPEGDSTSVASTDVLISPIFCRRGKWPHWAGLAEDLTGSFLVITRCFGIAMDGRAFRSPCSRAQSSSDKLADVSTRCPRCARRSFSDDLGRFIGRSPWSGAPYDNLFLVDFIEEYAFLAFAAKSPSIWPTPLADEPRACCIPEVAMSVARTFVFAPRADGTPSSSTSSPSGPGTSSGSAPLYVSLFLVDFNNPPFFFPPSAAPTQLSPSLAKWRPSCISVMAPPPLTLVTDSVAARGKCDSIFVFASSPSWPSLPASFDRPDRSTSSVAPSSTDRSDARKEASGTV
mmetsp:Transcript_7078/g.17562  ORF Transcript_7078/g.17562 Transcript_7078/m.17562 type:complete len:308 (+) Transcript_7078:938-1861(+)